MRNDKLLIIAGPVNGGLLAGIIWFVVNNGWKVGNAGLLERQPWPLSSWLTCIGIGVACGFAVGVTLAVSRARHSGALAQRAAASGLNFAPHVDRDQLSQYHRLSLFDKDRWSAAANRVVEQIQGVAVETLDYEFVARGNETNAYIRQTVALFPEAGRGLPCFILNPRGVVHNILFRLSGIDGITFEPDDSTSGFDREAVTDFVTAYFLSPPLESIAADVKALRRAGLASDEGTIAAMAGEPAIRRLFHLELLRFFAERTGWNVESDGEHLAIWQHNRIIPANERDNFLTEVIAIQTAVSDAAAEKPGRRVIAGRLRVDPRSRVWGLLAAVIGAFAGFWAGSLCGIAVNGAIFLKTLQDSQDPPVAIFAIVFFAFPIMGLMIGAIIGHRLQRKNK